MLHASYANPYRVPNWRWLRAAGYIDGSQPMPARRRDGPVGYKWIKRAANFYRQLLDCHNDLDMHRLAEADPDIFWARWAHEDTQSPMRWQLEAHLLARGSDWEVGYMAGVSPSIVEAYEALFFNVRDRLEHQGYIMHCVIGPAVQKGLSEREYDLLWKLYGYFNGPYLLQALITKFPNPGWCSTPDAVGSVIQDDAINTLKLKAAVAAKTVAVNSHTQLELLNIFTKFIEVERTTDTAGKAQAQIMDHISAMMSSMPFSIAGRDPHTNAQLPQGPLTVYRQSSVELSLAETLAVSTGQQLANQDMILQLGAVDEYGNSTAFPQSLTDAGGAAQP